MSSQSPVIAYGTSFTTSFLGMPATLRVASPINAPAPEVDVDIIYENSKSISFESGFFESLLVMLASIRQHTDLLAGAEFGFLTALTNDHRAVLIGKVGPAEITVFRKKPAALFKAYDVVEITIGQLSVEKELNDAFFQEIERLISAIKQAKRMVSQKISAYIRSGQQ